MTLTSTSASVHPNPSNSTNPNNQSQPQSSPPPPDLVSCLSSPCPLSALLSLSSSSDQLAKELASELSSMLPILPPLPKLLSKKSTMNPPHHPNLHTAHLATESISSSLSKIAIGGSTASSELRSLESHRRSLDSEADDISRALVILTRTSDAQRAARAGLYEQAAVASGEVDKALSGASERCRDMVGGAVEVHRATGEGLRRVIEERFEDAVGRGDVRGLSELTPLLGRLGLGGRGVRLYLEFSKAVLEREMTFDREHHVLVIDDKREDGMSRAAMRRKAEEEQRKLENATVPQKLARVYNAAVTHLRHHLPMVAYALGEVDGDAALVQLVHAEAEVRAVDLMRGCMEEKELGLTVRRAEKVAKKIEDRYAQEGGMAGGEDKNIANVIMGLGEGALGGSVDIVTKRNASLKDDCGFTLEVGTLSDVDAALEEWALILQHTESYERFLRHAVEEIAKARKLRIEQSRQEKRRIREMEEAKQRDPDVPIDGTPHRDDETADVEQEHAEIMPPHTQLNETAAEIGGCYSSLERCLLIASMQRAILRSNYPDSTTFHTANHANALQTTLVEECLYAARRSTSRAFATGHVGTASAGANVCADVLGRVLLEVLVHRAELGVNLLKPGEGLLDGQHGLGQAALSFAKSAGKGLRGVQGAGRAGVKGIVDEESAVSVKQRTMLGVARAAANFNDLDICADYTKRLEVHFLKEIDEGYPRGHDTEQLRMCIKGLGGVVDSFSQASHRSIERLVSAVMPRVRQIENDCVGQEGGSTGASASNFLGGPVMTGAATVTLSRLDYNLDDEAFELTQIGERYMSRMCSSVDELIQPLMVHLVPKLSDELLIGVLGGVSKRLEAAIRKSKFTPLGAISLDSDMRYLMNFAKDRIVSPELKSNVSLCKACSALGRLNQIALLLNVDDLEDALDLISVNKRKGNWDLKLDDAKTLLRMRVDFEGSKVNDLLQVDGES